MDRWSRGRWAEDLAAAHVVAHGYVVLWRNVRIGHLEVDLVAQREGRVIVVEVRTRGPGAYDRPLASVGRKKRAMLLRAARGLWRGRLKHMPSVERVRIDVIGVKEDGAVEWIRGAIVDEPS